MFDVALSNGGAQITLSTSSDDDHPPENMIDGKDETFWSTTGLFPQEVVVKFQGLMTIKSVELVSYNVKNVVVETSESDNSDNFEPLADRELDFMDHQLQTEEVKGEERKAQSLRLLINSGHDHFVAVYKLKVDGSAMHA